MSLKHPDRIPSPEALYWYLFQKFPETDLGDDDMRALNELLDHILTKKEATVIRHRFGIGRAEQSLSQIAGWMHISAARVGAIQKDALEKLYFFDREKLLRKIFGAQTEESALLVILKGQLRTLQEENRKLRAMKRPSGTNPDAFIVGNDHDLSLEDLDLSTLTYNCLNKAGIRTAEELLVTHKTWLLRIPQFGKKSFEDVKVKLLKRGYILPQNWLEP